MKRNKIKIGLAISTVLIMVFSASVTQAQWSTEMEKKSEAAIEAMTDKSWRLSLKVHMDMLFSLQLVKVVSVLEEHMVKGSYMKAVRL